jgi:hypothetical protein
MYVTSEWKSNIREISVVFMLCRRVRLSKYFHLSLFEHHTNRAAWAACYQSSICQRHMQYKGISEIGTDVIRYIILKLYLLNFVTYKCIILRLITVKCMLQNIGEPCERANTLARSARGSETVSSARCQPCNGYINSPPNNFCPPLPVLSQHTKFYLLLIISR